MIYGALYSGMEVVAQDVSGAFTPDETGFNSFNTDQKLAAIESLATMLHQVPGRKNLIHLSIGVSRTGQENQAELRATSDAAKQADVSLYTLDARATGPYNQRRRRRIEAERAGEHLQTGGR